MANDIGAWCNGNTWVSKTFVEGSSPSAPANGKPLKTLRFRGFLLAQKRRFIAVEACDLFWNTSAWCPVAAQQISAISLLDLVLGKTLILC